MKLLYLKPHEMIELNLPVLLLHNLDPLWSVMKVKVDLVVRNPTSVSSKVTKM